MKNLVKAIKAENKKNNQFKVDLIKNLQSNDVNSLDWRLSDLLTNGQKKKSFTLSELKEALKIRLSKHNEKQIESKLKELVFDPNLENIDTLTINVEWRKSQMWGSNPTAEAYIPSIGTVSSGSIGGCGYDKQSTAVANVLNQIPQFKKLMFELKNKGKNTTIQNRELFGYGAGYGVLPQFEGGVGVDCYYPIFEKIGYKFETISNGKNFDVYRISKIKK